MGELLPPVPTTPNNVTDSWQPLVESNVMSSYGMNKVTLTEWSTSTVIPAIAQGSAIDIDGSTARFVTGEPITDAPGNGTVYVMFTVSGTSVSASLTATAPTWDNTKGGWYGATGNRYSGHLMTKNGTSYTNKGRYRDESDGEQLIIEANSGIVINSLKVVEAPVQLNTSLSPLEVRILEAGTHIISSVLSSQLGGNGNAVTLQILLSGTWEDVASVGNVSGRMSILSDGVSYRIENPSNSNTATFYWAYVA